MVLATAVLFYAVAAGGTTHGITMIDPFTGAVPVVHYSFETKDDGDFDGLPDDWSRRKGPEFPSYIKASIDPRVGEASPSSLAILADGGAAVLYSPPIAIDAFHSWLLEGSIRTQRLQHNAAIISLSFLNHRWQRIERHLTKAVSGSHDGWRHVRLGPLTPPRDARYAVIGCHLVAGARQSDISGGAWFDNVKLMKLPQMNLISNFQTHFRQRSAPVETHTSVSGLDDGEQYSVYMEIEDSAGNRLAEIERDITPDDPAIAEVPGSQFAAVLAAEEARKAREQSVDWKLPPHEYGYYEIRAELRRGGTPILEARTSFTVLDLVDAPHTGEFGWSLETGPHEMPLRELADVAVQSGINWMKLPLWQSVYDDDKEQPGRIVEFFDRLSNRGITPVGLLNDPPASLRSKFARNWTGISEIFTMPSKFWSPPLAPVLAKYAASIRHWQLGGETDRSFIGMARMEETLGLVKQEFDRVGRDTRVGVHWGWENPLPETKPASGIFLSLASKDDMEADDLQQRLAGGRKTGARWVLLRPLSRSNHGDEERASDLVKQMVAARIGGADAIFASDVFDPEYGFLKLSGAPTRLYLPWRTTAVALQGAEYLGSFAMLGGSTNHVFAREREMMMVVWNDNPVTELIYLGENVVANDIWGRQQVLPVDRRSGMQMVPVGPMPLTIRGGSEPIARWRLAAKFEKGRVPSAYGEHQDAIVGINTFHQGANGSATVTFPPEWSVEPSTWPLQVAAGEKFRLPMTLTLPPNANLGPQNAVIQFDIVADRPYRFRVFQKYEVGLGDIHVDVTDRKLPDGRLEIEQVITNATSPLETLNFRCTLFVPGQRRQILFVTKLGQGEDRKIYHIPDAEALRGQELWIRAEQVGGLRVLNYKWRVSGK